MRILNADIPVPWRLQKSADDVRSAFCYYRNTLARPAPRAARPKVQFLIPYYGYTGASAAMLSIAGLLADDCEVYFRSHPTNVMNQFVPAGVRIVPGIVDGVDICVLESGEDIGLVRALVARGVRIIASMHGGPPTADGLKNHGYDDTRIADVTALASSIHYIDDSQRDFVERYREIHHRKIANCVEGIRKTTRTRCAGIVGDTTLARKNVAGSLAAAERSRADRVHVWGKHAGQASTPRVQWHGFSRDKAAIFNSFDVLVHLSRLEVQPLVVLEALSAGIPCVLSDIPCFQSLLGMEGVWLVDADDVAGAAAAVDAALVVGEGVRDGLVRYWEAHHAPAAVRRQWVEYVGEVMTITDAKG